MNVDDDDADGPLDPRIEMELENLNNATDDINQLEIELDEARRTFTQLQSYLKNQFIEEQNKAGLSNIEKSKAYYEAVAARNEAQIKCRREAEAYRKASENLATAIETESVAMSSFKLNQHEFNDSWQEWLNQVTTQVMEDTNKKIASEREHQKIMAHCTEAEKLVKELGEKYKKALIKTKRYYEIKERIDQELPLQKEKIRCLEKSIQRAKCIYATSLRALEEISNQIHQQRRDYDIIANGPREPGVGAELESPSESLKSEDQKLPSRKISMESDIDEDDKKETEKDLQDVRKLRNTIDNFKGRAADGSESSSNQWELELKAGLEKLNNHPITLMQRIAKESSPAEQPAQPGSQVHPNQGTLATNPEPNDTAEGSKKSVLDSISNQGWHSLTQSPINSIISRSKTAFKNSFSKSLASSPVNKSAFAFIKPKVQPLETSLNSNKATLGQTQCTKRITNESRHHSLDSTPTRKDARGLEPSDKSNKMSELPLLSIFNTSKSDGRSCSLVNLNEKKNLNIPINKTAMNNIQTVSMERLASARYKIISESS